MELGLSLESLQGGTQRLLTELSSVMLPFWKEKLSYHHVCACVHAELGLETLLQIRKTSTEHLKVKVLVAQ